MLWNLGFLEEEEKSNSDYKQLIDNLRTYGLYPYYLSKNYHNAAEKELGKVDWDRQPVKSKKQYQRPLFWMRIIFRIGVLGGALKRIVFSLSK